MAGPNIPTNRSTSSTIAEHVSDHNTITPYVNKLDTTVLTDSYQGGVLKYDSTAAAYKASVGGPEWVVNVDDYIPKTGITPGVTDVSSYVITARNAVFNSRASSIPARPVLQFGPKTYRIQSPDALWPINSALIYGYEIRGVERRVTRILFSPTGTSASLTDMNLMTLAGTGGQKSIGFRCSNLTFESDNATASFAYFYSVTTSNANIQDTVLTDVRFDGTWKRAFALDGDSAANLNSEMGFDYVSTNGSTFSEAFLENGITSPSTNSQQDQFVNHWYRNCKFELVSGDVLRYPRGGHIKVDAGSFIYTGAAGGTFFKMAGNFSRADSVQYLLVEGTRFELRTGGAARVIDSEWRHGNVTFLNCSDDASGFSYQIMGTGAGLTNYDTHIYRSSNNTFPTVKYQGCGLMGYHRIVTTGTVPTPGKIIYEGCGFKNMQSGGVSLLSSATNQFLRYDSAVPHYRFQDCRGVTDVNA